MNRHRRIDVTIERLEKSIDALTREQRDRLADPQCAWWAVVVVVARVRAMERAEESVRAAPVAPMADTYDRVAQPGEHAVEALLRTFKAMYGGQAEACG
jgi:hypothetical protein